MKESNYWQQFLNTGSIEDYLRYKGKQETENVSQEHMVMGDSPYAGVGETDRDGFEGGAYRGIR